MHLLPGGELLFLSLAEGDAGRGKLFAGLAEFFCKPSLLVHQFFDALLTVGLIGFHRIELDLQVRFLGEKLLGLIRERLEFPIEHRASRRKADCLSWFCASRLVSSTLVVFAL